MDQISFYKWLTNIGLVLFVSFSYFYYSHIGELEQQIIDLGQQIEVDNAEIDATSSNTTKVKLIKTNLAKVDSMSAKKQNLMIYRVVAIVFITAGLGLLLFGLNKIKSDVFPKDEDEE